jgi:flagellar hook-length control protein FliK
MHPLAAAYAARVDWRPGGGAAGGQAGDQGGPGSGDMGAPARLLAALEEMRQSGGSASSQGAAAFAAALSSSQATTGPAPGAAEPAPIRLSNPWPVDHPAFPAHLAEQVGDSLLAGLDRAEITVTPPEMGPIRIELSLNGEQASVAFSAAQPDTRTAIEQSLPLLKSMLSEQGLQLADSSVGSGYRPPADAGAQSPAGDGAGSRGNGQTDARAGGAGTSLPAGVSGGGTPSAGRANGLLDLFA